MNIKEKNLYYDKYSVVEPIKLGSGRDLFRSAYNLNLNYFLSLGQTDIFACDKIEDINNFIGDGQNSVIINFEINDTNCDVFYDFLRPLKETSDILIRNCSSIAIIENMKKMSEFIPNLDTIRSSDWGSIYKCLDLEKKNLSIRNKKCKNANK